MATATYFVGAYYEETNGVATKYYYAGAQRVAMRKGTTLYYLLSDHLGSTSLTTDANGVVISEVRYTPWGEVRYNAGVTPTDYTYTGQYSDSYINLLWYGSRHYDPYLGRFTSPDSIIPGTYNSQAYDRYSYVFNNPLRYTDPTGHKPDCDGDGMCGQEKSVDAELWSQYKVKLKGNWDSRYKLAVLLGVMAVGNKFGEVLGKAGGAAFIEVFGKMTFTWGSCNECDGSGGYTYSNNDIRFASMSAFSHPDYLMRARNNVVHELGHAFNNLWSKNPENWLVESWALDPLLQRGEDDNFNYGFASKHNQRTWVQNPEVSGTEVFADQFLGWTFDTWETSGKFGVLSREGAARSAWMTTNMTNWLIVKGQ